MRTIGKVWLLAAAMGMATQARAQGPLRAGIAPVIEAGAGYAYVKSDVPSQGNIAMNGLVASANGDFSRRFGVKVEVGYSRSFDAFQTGRSADILTYMGGPVFYAVRKRKFDVHAQVLVGGARETGVNFEENGGLVRGYVNHFAWAGGAGIQYRLTGSLSIRPEVEYLRTSYFQFGGGD